VSPSFAIDAPALSAHAALLIDADTGDVLFEKNADTLMYPASTTKILSTIIFLEDLSLDEKVTIAPEAVAVDGSHIALEPGEVLTVEDLLYAMMVQSANDAAEALAIHHSGSVEAFAEVMNERAQEMGATSSRFKNPHGLTEENHVTTARDLAIIARYAYRNETFRKLASTPSYTIDATPQKGEPRYLHTKNKLLRDVGATMVYKGERVPVYNPEIDGIKTGYTVAAQNCYVGTMEKDGIRLISVTLKSSSDGYYPDIVGLLDYGFETFKRVVLIESDELVETITLDDLESTTVDLYPAETVAKLLPREASLGAVERDILINDPLSLPINAGESLGTMTFRSGDVSITTVPLVAREAYTDGLFVAEATTILHEEEPFYKRWVTPTAKRFLLKLLIALVLWRTLVAIAAYRRKMRAFKRARREKSPSRRGPSYRDE
jgi:D-alanyl-D-alanine carboxypeptidase (penicillin-binding protein 5/6)